MMRATITIERQMIPNPTHDPAIKALHIVHCPVSEGAAVEEVDGVAAGGVAAGGVAAGGVAVGVCAHAVPTMSTNPTINRTHQVKLLFGNKVLLLP
jgi:hypothetical protein